MRAAGLLAFAVTGAMLATSPVALAGWSAPQRIEREPFPEPRVGFEVPPDDATPWAVRFRGGETVAIPGSEGAGQAAVGTGPRGLIAAAWTLTPDCESEADAGRPCVSRVFATVWRRGQAPPAGRAVSREGTDPDAPFAVIGRDGTVVVAWTVGDTDGVDAAVGRGTGALATAPVAATGRLYDAGVVRGAPQLVVLGQADNRTTVSLAGAAGGRLEAPRVEARVPGAHDGDLSLLRTARGDRLLLWTDTGSTELRFRTGAPGRRLGAVRRTRADGYDAALGARGDFAVLTQSGVRSGVFRPLRALRGRTGKRRVSEQLLRPIAVGLSGPGLGADVAVDAAGTAYAVWERRRREDARGGAGTAIRASVARRGRRFGPGRIVSGLDRNGACVNATVVVTGRGRAAARWTCSSASAGGRFDEGARYTRGG